MKVRNLIFFGMFMAAPTFVYGACSVANLTKCLDSVCAINMGANPAARCQYCGSASAGEPTKSTAMKSVSAGSSTKYSISDKELKKAPKDPGERYMWGTKLCLEKVKDCTPDDVTDNYDSLIEQSCTAAGIAADFANLAEEINEQKTQTSCSSDISLCMTNAKHCANSYKNCESDADFDKYFSQCSVEATGCDEFLASIRTNLMASRKTAYDNADKLLERIVSSYKTAREKRLAEAQTSCTDNLAKLDCIERVCAYNLRNKCAIGFEYEKTVAEQLCKFYDIACERLK